MVYAYSLEIRTVDNRLICMARIIEGDILLTLKSAGKEVHVPYTDIPRLVAMAKERAKGHKQK